MLLIPLYVAGSDLTSPPVPFFPLSTDGGGFGKVCRVLKLFSHYYLNKPLLNILNQYVRKYHSLYQEYIIEKRVSNFHNTPF